MSKKSSANSPNKKGKDRNPSPVKLQVGDVLLGRGSGVSHHPGNIRFRLLVKLYKEEYNNTARNLKMDVAQKIVKELQAMKPPGRFLEKSETTHKYVHVHVKIATEKTAQALRERKWSPFCRKEAFATLKDLNAKLLKLKDPQDVKEPTVPLKTSPPTKLPKSNSSSTKTTIVKKGTMAKKPLVKSKPLVQAARNSTNNDSQREASTNNSHETLSNAGDRILKSNNAMLPPSSETGSKLIRMPSKVSVTPPPRTHSPPIPPLGQFKRLERLVNEAVQQEFDLFLATLPPKLYESYYQTYFAATTPAPTDTTLPSATSNQATDHRVGPNAAVIAAEDDDDDPSVLLV